MCRMPSHSLTRNPCRRNLSAELMSGRGGMSMRTNGGPMPTASADITIDTPLPDGMSLLYNEVAAEQAAARSAWETQQYSMERLWGVPSISEDVLGGLPSEGASAPPELTKEIGSVRSRMFAPRNRAASFPGVGEADVTEPAVGVNPSEPRPAEMEPARQQHQATGAPVEGGDQSMLPPPPGVPDTRPAHVIDPTWGRVGRSYSTSKPKAPRTGRSSGDKERTSGGKAGKKQKKKRVVRQQAPACNLVASYPPDYDANRMLIVIACRCLIGLLTTGCTYRW